MLALQCDTCRIKDVDLKYLAIVDDSKSVEKCLKINLEKYRYIKKREIYKVDIKVLHKIVE